jgi:hypothetical protein
VNRRVPPDRRVRFPGRSHASPGIPPRPRCLTAHQRQTAARGNALKNAGLGGWDRSRGPPDCLRGKTGTQSNAELSLPGQRAKRSCPHASRAMTNRARRRVRQCQRAHSKRPPRHRRDVIPQSQTRTASVIASGNAKSADERASAVAGRPHGGALRWRCCNQSCRFPARRAFRPDYPGQSVLAPRQDYMQRSLPQLK